jgi:hypothetical protein
MRSRRHYVGFALIVLGASTFLIFGEQHDLFARGHSSTNRESQATTFSQSCSQPNYPGAQTAIDSLSGLSGSGGAEGPQNTAKNNFCASGPAKPITISEMVGLQNQVQVAKNIPFGNPDIHPLTTSPGPATDRRPLVALGEGSKVVLNGFVKIARQEGAESVNCGRAVPNQPAYHDIHI